MPGERVTAGAATGAIVAAVSAIAGLAAATGGTSMLTGYVSEAGIAGAPHADLYRISIFAAAAALALLAVAVRAISRPAAATLAVAAPCVALAGVIRCSTGCPLPPYEAATPADLAHAAASIAGVVLCTAAMLVLASPSVDPAVRRPARVSLVVALPVNAAVGAAMVLAGRGALTGVLERLALVALLGCLVAVALARVRTGRTRR